MNKISLVMLIALGHAACGGGGGSDGSDPSITISDPTDASLIRATVTIVVDVANGDADSVRLLVDGTVVEEKLVPPYEFDWDTTAVNDGTHTITALATVADLELNASVDLDVDNTAPTALTQTPLPGAENVWLGSTIALTTSEAIAPSSTFTVQDGDGNQIASTATIDDDGVVIALTEQPMLPSDLTIVVAATDLVGNALDLDAPWTFNAPAALHLPAPSDDQLDKDAYLTDFIADGPNAFVAVWALDQEVHVGRFDGTSWLSGPVADGFDARVALASGASPYVAHIARTQTGHTTGHVVQFDGTSFEQLGANIGNGGPIFSVDIATDSTGTPYITWAENYRVYVAKWNGKWQPIGGALTTIGTGISMPRIVMDHNDNPVVSYQQFDGDAEYVFAWRHEDAMWKSLGGKIDAIAGANTHARAPHLVIGADNNPIIAWVENNGAGTVSDVYARRWDGSLWQPLADGLSQRTDNTMASAPKLAIDSSDRVTLAWYEGISDTSDSIPVWRFDGSDWTAQFDTQRDVTESTYIIAPTLQTLVVNDTAYVMWSEQRTDADNNTWALTLRKENRLP